MKNILIPIALLTLTACSADTKDSFTSDVDTSLESEIEYTYTVTTGPTGLIMMVTVLILAMKFYWRHQRRGVTMSASGCSVVSGYWYDPFGDSFMALASDLGIDHVIPLKWAHSHGGAEWSLEKKERFANDRKNLLAVDDGLNSSKGAKGLDQWLPPNVDYWCDYTGLWMDLLDAYPDFKLGNTEQIIFNGLLIDCS